jgi:hypothetical protein
MRVVQIEPGPMPYLHRVRARVDQRARRLGGGDVAGHHLYGIRQALHPFHGEGHALGMAMSGVDHDQVAARIDQRLGPFEPRIAHGRRRRHAQAAQFILAGRRVQHRLLGILERQKPGELAIGIGDQKLLDPPRLHQADRLAAVRRFTQDGEVLTGHHHAHGRVVGLGEAHVAVGDDPEDAALSSTTGNPVTP